ncbi:hypothetical protein M438DRAFT_285826 [Aureobasidium pullulans EXF-150]|uniref:N-acetyltransferase domain-containing protein n=1 Tax=Aureobasidium pullulans EXF-150 TaxID=1043002 RepID=A0A074WYW1_AURPU|nr:uncharacterized protein M438DRAFT_285826 [Aureobasidium pullulans EXF-150]KEQ78388.1 hypothetical protein M438DRAFT_285826 [Aureobasidium pullulans EXF-150]
MSAPVPQTTNFAVKTKRLILLPTPLAIDNEAYRSLYASLHRMPEFTTMAFGESWGTKDWTTSSVREIIVREVARSWKVRGMGDFAIGLRSEHQNLENDDDVREHGFKIVEAEVQRLEDVRWIGYVGIRDATTTSMLNELTAVPSIRGWQEMVELRYGFHPDAWGKGFGTEAAKAVMGWGQQEKGVQRFIAETERENKGSGGVLGKLGFTEIDERTEIVWGMEGTKEWERGI